MHDPWNSTFYSNVKYPRFLKLCNRATARSHVTCPFKGKPGGLCRMIVLWYLHPSEQKRDTRSRRQKCNHSWSLARIRSGQLCLNVWLGLVGARAKEQTVGRVVQKENHYAVRCARRLYFPIFPIFSGLSQQTKVFALSVNSCWWSPESALRGGKGASK